MGMWCDLQSHLTRPCPLPHPKPCPHVFSMFVPAKHTNQVADLQKQLFSLFFLDSSIIALNIFLVLRMSNCMRVSQKQRNSSPQIHTCTNDFVFYSVLLYCQSSDCPLIAACAVVCSSSSQFVHVHSFCKSATLSKIVGRHGGDKWKYNMSAWLWVGQWVWPVEK